MILLYWRSSRSRSRPQPTNKTRSQSKPGTLCNISDWPSLPSMSPRLIRLDRYFLLAESMALAAVVNFRGSCTPTMIQAVRCFSGLPLLMLNSIIFCTMSLIILIVRRSHPVAPDVNCLYYQMYSAKACGMNKASVSIDNL